MKITKETKHHTLAAQETVLGTDDGDFEYFQQWHDRVWDPSTFDWTEGCRVHDIVVWNHDPKEWDNKDPNSLVDTTLRMFRDAFNPQGRDAMNNPPDAAREVYTDITVKLRKECNSPEEYIKALEFIQAVTQSELKGSSLVKLMDNYSRSERTLFDVITQETPRLERVSLANSDGWDKVTRRMYDKALVSLIELYEAITHSQDSEQPASLHMGNTLFSSASVNDRTEFILTCVNIAVQLIVERRDEQDFRKFNKDVANQVIDTLDDPMHTRSSARIKIIEIFAAHNTIETTHRIVSIKNIIEQLADTYAIMQVFKADHKGAFAYYALKKQFTS